MAYMNNKEHRCEDIELYAHTPNNGKWHILSDHLLDVAQVASEVASSFGKSEQAFWLGLIHDVGKINPSFQDYLRKVANNEFSKSEPHSVWGAAYLYTLIYKNRRVDSGWEEYCVPIMGHHAGLADPGICSLKIERFLKDRVDAIGLIKGYLENLRLHLGLKGVPRLSLIHELDALKREFDIRMVYSALVDADYLDTEKHFNNGKSALRKAWPNLRELYNRFEQHRRAYIDRLKEKPSSDVIEVREYVYNQCIRKSVEKPGVFTLTAPTGSGKTLGYFGFALKHAITHGKIRIIVVLPYTSIIDQTAKVISDIVGEDAVLEHHSALDLGGIDDEERVDRYLMAMENWDAPIIITTTVQFFESLLTNRPGKARKIHNIANSVVVLDEVQALPSEVLTPTLNVLDILVKDYGVSLVLSTATQPAFENLGNIDIYGTLKGREIITNYESLFQRLKRVDFKMAATPIAWDEIAKLMTEKDQIMVILNTRADALRLFNMLVDIDTENVFHLSSMLCAKHRQGILKEIGNRLSNGLPIRLVTTQVVEAGVDLDFPEVWRAIGPLDRIVQAAGRCNRNGKQSVGMVVVFEPEGGGTPSGPYKVGIEKSKIILAKRPADDLHQPEIYREYFAHMYRSVNLDAYNVQTYRQELNYPKVAQNYRLIKDETAMVVVPYEKSSERLSAFMKQPSRETWRGLQPYVVNIRAKDIVDYLERGYVREITRGVFEWIGPYDKNRGLSDIFYDPADLIVDN